MNESQEPKYAINHDGRLFNRSTLELIPEDEPVFILRAQDKNAALTISFYKQLCLVLQHKRLVNLRLHDFVRFAHKNPERMKEPGSGSTTRVLFDKSFTEPETPTKREIRLEEALKNIVNSFGSENLLHELARGALNG